MKLLPLLPTGDCLPIEKQTYWQPLQGYEVLDFAAKNGIRSLFALTSQADFVVHHLRNLMGIRFSMFKKENLKNSLTNGKCFLMYCLKQVNSAVKSSGSICQNQNNGRMKLDGKVIQATLP
jgi:hypothetical protein